MTEDKGTWLSCFLPESVGGMDDRMQTTQPARIQFRSFSAECTQEIRPKPKLAAVFPSDTETTPNPPVCLSRGVVPRN